LNSIIFRVIFIYFIPRNPFKLKRIVPAGGNIVESQNLISPILKKLKTLFFCLFAMTCIAPVLQAQYFGYKINSGKKSTRIEYEVFNNLIVIPVKMNNQVPLKFIMDTGVRSTIITDKDLTDVLNLPYNRVITINGPGDFSLLEAYVVSQVDLFLDGVTGYDQTILVLKDDYLKLKNFMGTDVHGMIGYDLYNRFVMGFDFANKTVSLCEPRKFVPPKKFTVLPLLIEDTKPYIWATVVTGDTTHVRVKLMIDTGASHSLLLKEDPRNGIILPEKTISTEIGRGLGGSIDGKLAKIKSLTIGDFTFNDLVTSFPNPDNYPDTLSITRRSGTIGGEILSRFFVYFDYRHGKLYLKKNQSYKREFGYNMSGLTIRADGQDLKNFTISQVRKDSPAERADIRINDSIILLNGLSAQDLTLSDIYKIFNYKPGKIIRIYLRRNNEVLKKQFVLEDLI
jgi:hypothetical protein